MDSMPFHVVEGFLSHEECEHFLNVINEKATDDQKPGYKGLGLINQENLENNTYPNHLDPNKVLLLIIDKVRDHFLSTYEMAGTFVFDRIFGNVMEEGTIHPHHRDEERGVIGGMGEKKRSQVCSIVLNDDYEGGELTFNDHNIQIKPKPGSLILFRGYDNVHGVNRVEKGRRVNLLVFFYDVID
jgi:predicted 2-oxoglutarate/Fe(II)-dependent dioxygenase YbiX